MQAVFLRKDLPEYRQDMEERVAAHIGEDLTQAFESFESCDLMGFDWYDVRERGAAGSQILAYIDREDLFLICEDERARARCAELLPEGQSNVRALYLFFVRLLGSDMTNLDRLETEVTSGEEETLEDSQSDYLEKIRGYRRELLRLKRYYEQLDLILDNLTANDNGLFSREEAHHFQIIHNRVEIYRGSVLNLRDYVTQMREAWQAQLDLQQNNLMRVFTVITAVFLPLTLIVGWYGMNFTGMRELEWRYGYLGVTILSAAVCGGLLLWFKHKKWI